MPQIPDMWGRVLTAALGAVLPVLVAALVGLPAWVKSRWDAKRRQDELMGEVQLLRETVELLRQEGADGRARQDREMRTIREAQHVQMRHELIHDAEKMIGNGFATTAERQSWWESYSAYDALGENGYIAAYWPRIQSLEIREV